MGAAGVCEFGVRFGAMTFVGERITCTGKVVDKQERDGEQRAGSK